MTTGGCSADLGREHVFGRFEIVARMSVYPERSTGLKELAEQRRRVRCHGILFTRNAFDLGAPPVQRGCHGVVSA